MDTSNIADEFLAEDPEVESADDEFYDPKNPVKFDNFTFIKDVTKGNSFKK